MCILPSTPTSAQPHAAPTPARALGPQQRQQLAVEALAGQAISVLASISTEPSSANISWLSGGKIAENLD